MMSLHTREGLGLTGSSVSTTAFIGFEQMSTCFPSLLQDTSYKLVTVNFLEAQEAW